MNTTKRACIQTAKRLLLLIATLLCTSSAVFADHIDKTTALNNTLSFIKQTNKKTQRKAFAAAAVSKLAEALATPYYYVFNIGDNEGYVIASAEDCTQPVLGYSDEGRFDKDNIPDGLSDYLAAMREAVEKLSTSNMAYSFSSDSADQYLTASTELSKDYVPTLLSAKWNQNSPYNLYSPTYLNDSSEAVHCSTGCVATAMAQVMYYNKWPRDSTSKLPSYSTSVNGVDTVLPALPASLFDWDDMTSIYGGSSTDKSNYAVAKLMQYCGWSVSMKWGSASSAVSSKVVTALKNYFGYDQNLRYCKHDYYTGQGWEDLIYRELEARRPVLMNASGSFSTGAHEFAIDGYDGNGYYHVNWGWGGHSNGYYLLTVMKPGSQGIGGTSSSDGYSFGQGVAIGIQPPTGDTLDPSLSEIKCTMYNIACADDTYSLTRLTKLFNFKFDVNYSAGTSMTERYKFNAGFALYDSDDNFIKICGYETFSLTPGYYFASRTVTVKFGASLTSGQYKLIPVSKQSSGSQWYPVDGADIHYFVVDIDGNTAYITPMPTINLKVNSLDIVGAVNTSYDGKVKANITNNGSEYFDELYLMEDQVGISGNFVKLPAGKTTDIYFVYKPSSIGTHTLALCRGQTYDESKVIYTENKTISSTTNSLTVTGSIVTTGSYIYGNRATVNVTVKNTGTLAYNDYIRVTKWRKETPSSNVGWSDGTAETTVYIEPGASTTTTIQLTDLDIGYSYFFSIAYNGGGGKLRGTYAVRDGIVTWTEDGGTTGAAAPTSTASTYTFAKNAVAVQIPGTIMPKFNTAQMNPNCLVYIDGDASLDASSGVTNIIKGNQAEQIVIDGDTPFLVPETFTAKHATMSVPLNEATAYGSWQTLWLPFAASTASVDNTNVDWFHTADDTAKYFVVKYFASITDTILNFDYVDLIQPNVPYIVSTKGTVGESPFNVSGKTVTFEADNVLMEATGSVSAYTSNYRFAGANRSAELSGIYVLNPNGHAFEYTTDKTTVAPFSAYFLANTDEAAAVGTLPIYNNYEGNTSAINSVQSDLKGVTNVNNSVHDLSGRQITNRFNTHATQLLPKGIYITNGKTIAVK